MANRLKLTPEKMQEIFEEVAKDANTRRACLVCGISTNAFYDKMRKEPELWKERYNQAVEEGTDNNIDECRRRAFEGCNEAVYHQGEVVGFKRVFSDTLAMFLIKARRPEFRDRMIDIPTEGKFSLTINTEGKKDEQSK